MNCLIYLSFLYDTLSPLLLAAGAAPWLIALTLAVARLLDSPACTRAATELVRPTLFLTGMSLAATAFLLPWLTYEANLAHQPGAPAAYPWTPALTAASWQLGGLLALAYGCRSGARRPTRLLLATVAAGILFLATRICLSWPIMDAGQEPISRWTILAGTLFPVLRSQLTALGLASALALVWQERYLDEDGQLIARLSPDRAVPARWFAALAAASYGWRMAGAWWGEVHEFVHYVYPLMEVPGWLPPQEVMIFLRGVLASTLLSIGVASWLLIAFRPCRACRKILGRAALAALAGRWLLRQIPVMWGTWQSFHHLF